MKNLNLFVLSLLSIMLFASCDKLEDILGNENNVFEEGCSLAKLDLSNYPEWQSGIINDEKTFFIIKQDSLTNGYVGYINNTESNNNGVALYYDENFSITEFISSNMACYFHRDTENMSDIVIFANNESYIIEDVPFQETVSELHNVKTRSIDWMDIINKGAKGLKETFDMLGKIETFQNFLAGEDKSTINNILEDLATSGQISNKPLLALLIMGGFESLDNAKDELQRAGEKMCLGDCEVRIQRVDKIGKQKYKLQLIVSGFSSLPTLSNRTDEKYVVYTGIALRKGWEHVTYSKNDFKTSELLVTKDGICEPIEIELPENSTYYAVPYLLPTKRGKYFYKSYIKHGDVEKLAYFDGYIKNKEQTFYEIYEDDIRFVCYVTAVIEELEKDIIEWGIYTSKDNSMFEGDYNYYPSSWNRLEEEVRMEFTLPLSSFDSTNGITGKRNIKVGIYKKHKLANGSIYFSYGELEDFELECDLSTERKALIEFYNATNGEKWNNNTNWCSNEPIEKWYGITVDETNSVMSIKLDGNNLTGENVYVDLSQFKKLKEFNVNDNPMGSFLITGNNLLSEIELKNVATNRIHVEDIHSVIIDCPNLCELSGNCTILKVQNCNFGDNHTPFSGISATDVTIYNCKMHSCGQSSEVLTFESSSTYDTWYCKTSKKLNIINSYCSTICGGDFNNGTIINLQNATLWRSNWDEESRVTLTCTITGAGWDNLFH